MQNRALNFLLSLQSLVHFTLTNPGWKMPDEAKQFVHSIKRHAMHDIDRTKIGTNTAMEQSLFSVGSMGGEVSHFGFYSGE